MSLVTPAHPDDLPAISELYQDAFPEALEAVFGKPRIPARAVQDVFALLYRFEPAGVQVVRDGARVRGFVVSVLSLRRLERSLIRGGLWTILRRFMSGRYAGLGWGWVPRLGKAMWQFYASETPPETRGEMAQMLSLVVEAGSRGQGLGRQLAEASLALLRKQGAKRVRLEVDAAKTPAVHLYETLGFRTVATMPSPRGPALIMLKDL